MPYSEREKRIALYRAADKSVTELCRIPFMSGSYDESWLQELIDDHPRVLPTMQFGEDYTNLVSIAREVKVSSGENTGYIDNLLISQSGHLVIVETKLFRNQEARREVVAQILDYAKDVRRWDMEKLDAIAADYYYKKEGQAFRVVDLMYRAGYLTTADEASFIDNVNCNLADSSFLLAIVGDGIRSGVEQIADFLKDNSASSVCMALIELEMYQHGDGIIVIPNTLVKTAVVERFVIVDGRSIVRVSDPPPVSGYQSKPVLKRREFIQRFADIGGYSEDDIVSFIGDAEQIAGVFIDIAPTELSIKCKIGNTSAPILTFAIPEYKHADLYMRPSRIVEKMEDASYFPCQLDELLEFYRPYIDLKRCSVPPYDMEKPRFYYADVSRVLADESKFMSAIEAFAHKVYEN